MLLQVFGFSGIPQLRCSFPLSKVVSDMVPNWSKVVPTWSQSWPKLVPDWPQVGPKLVQIVSPNWCTTVPKRGYRQRAREARVVRDLKQTHQTQRPLLHASKLPRLTDTSLHASRLSRLTDTLLHASTLYRLTDAHVHASKLYRLTDTLLHASKLCKLNRASRSCYYRFVVREKVYSHTPAGAADLLLS